MEDDSGFDPGSRPSGILNGGSSSGFNLGKFLVVSAAFAAGAGVGIGAYYGVRVAGEESGGASNPPPAQPEPPDGDPATDPEADDDKAAGPRLDVPAVDEPSDPGVLRLDVPEPWGIPGSQSPKPASGVGVTQEEL